MLESRYTGGAEITISSRNKKCALSRWRKIHKHQLDQINPDKILLARLCGFLAGDGSVQIRKEQNGKTHHSIEFFPDDVSLVLPFVAAFQSVFKLTPKIVKSSSHFRIRTFSKSAVSYLTGLADFGINEWSPPPFLMANEKAKTEWLRAFFDSEAYVGESVIRVQSVNARGLNSVENLLVSFGIACTRFTYVPKKENWSKVYILVISRKRDRLKFLNKIGFNHKWKLTKLISQFESAEVA